MERQRAPPKGREAENGSRGIDSRGRIPERLCRCHSRYAKEKRAEAAATEGSIRVYDYDGCCIYSYYGKIRINSDGKDGKEIDVEALGYLEGYQEHKEESRAGE